MASKKLTDDSLKNSKIKKAISNLKNKNSIKKIKTMFKCKDMDECAYPFLYDIDSRTDWEVLTDGFSSVVGKAVYYTEQKYKEYKNSDLILIKDMLIKIQTMILHANSSIRGKLGIDEESIGYIKTEYKHYRDKYSANELTKQGFILPLGGELTMAFHECRGLSKQAVRQLVKMEAEGIYKINECLPRFFSSLTNLFFVLALVSNYIDGKEEVSYKSKSYNV